MFSSCLPSGVIAKEGDSGLIGRIKPTNSVLHVRRSQPLISEFNFIVKGLTNRSASSFLFEIRPRRNRLYFRRRRGSGHQELAGSRRSDTNLARGAFRSERGIFTCTQEKALRFSDKKNNKQQHGNNRTEEVHHGQTAKKKRCEL